MGFGLSEVTAARLRRAEQALASCRILLASGDAEGSCNRAYYAMFYASHVALEHVKIIPVGTVYKTHNGLIAAFSKHLVLSGHVDEGLGRALSKVHDLRLLADYNGDPPAVAKAGWAVEQAATFVREIQALIECRSIV